jgi:leucyl aminopeptidase
VALGPDLPALYGSDASLAGELAAAGREADDPLGPMPLWSPYEAGLSSTVADLNNVSSDAFAGSIYGALFLKRFVSRAAGWAHLDVFAWNPRARPGRPEGAVTHGVRAVSGWLARRYAR